MSRSYLVFGSDDGANWAMLNTVEANGSEQALNKARDQETHRHYAAVPERNWSQGTPQVVERPPVVKWTTVGGDQLSVDDVLEETAKDEAIKEAKEALGVKPETRKEGVL